MLVVEVLIRQEELLEEDTALHEEVKERCAVHRLQASMAAEEAWDLAMSRLGEASAALRQVMTTVSWVKDLHAVSRLHMEPRLRSSPQCRSARLLRWIPALAHHL
jgi:hypothetical protein